MPARPLHIALIGSRAVPNRYSGYETLMEELKARLVRQSTPKAWLRRAEPSTPTSHW